MCGGGERKLHTLNFKNCILFTYNNNVFIFVVKYLNSTALMLQMAGK